MYSISQNYVKLLEKIIKETINQELSFKGFNDYLGMMSMMNIHLSKLIREAIVQYFETIDKMYKDSKERKLNYYYKNTYPRTLITIFGEIRFERTYYYSKNNEKETGFFYVDKLLDLPRKDNYDPMVKAMLMKEKANTTYSKAAEIVSNKISEQSGQIIQISRQLVYQIFKNFELEEIEENDKKQMNSDVLYIILDEKYVHTQKNNKQAIMVKHACVYTGKKLEYKNRFKLLNKAVFSTLESYDVLLHKVEAYIDKTFVINCIKNIICAGDGASWILSFYKDLHLTYSTSKVFVLDPFHIGQAITRITTDKYERSLLRNYLNARKKKDFSCLCEALLAKYPQRLEKIIQNRDYLISNWNYIHNKKNKLFIGCPMESQISHNLAKVFARDPKAYSPHLLSKHIQLRDLQLNGVSISSLYLSSLGYLQNDDSLGYFEFPIRSNIPILESNLSLSRNIMHDICYPKNPLFD